jgi:hypothetical protein
MEILMADPVQPPPSDPVHAAFQEGRRFGLATAALALSIVSFLNMFGLEKSILAIVLAILSRQGAVSAAAAWRRGRTALIVASVHIVTVVAVLILIRQKFGGLLNFLHKLS